MSKASRETFLQELRSGNIKSKAVQILDYIEAKGRQNTFQMRSKLIYPHQTLTSSLSLLQDFGLIKVVGTVAEVINGRNSSCSVFEFVYNENEQIKLQNQRLFEKAQIWLKNYDKFKDVLNITLTKNQY